MKKSTLLLIIFLLLFSTFTLPSKAKATLNITSSKQEYNIGETVILKGNLTSDGNPVSNALISLEIDDPKGRPFIIRTFPSGQEIPQNLPIEIANIITCDSSGNPKDTFKREDDMGLKITLKNNVNNAYNIIVTINMFYCNGVPFKAFIAYNGSIDGKQTITFTLWPIIIPSNAPQGTAILYACVFDKLPAEGGQVYSLEKNATFNILSPSQIKETLQVNNGNFNLTFPLTTIPIPLGNYSVYTAAYQSLTPDLPPIQITYSTCSFKVILIGDINNDGTVDGVDIAVVCRAYGSEPGDENWNPDADLNNDNIVDGIDVAIVCRAFGVTAITDP